MVAARFAIKRNASIWKTGATSVSGRLRVRDARPRSVPGVNASQLRENGVMPRPDTRSGTYKIVISFAHGPEVSEPAVAMVASSIMNCGRGVSMSAT